MSKPAATILAILFVLQTSPVTAADDGEKPSVTGARMFVNGDVVMSDLTCRNLFSERIVGTVQSGLPAVVELLYQLVTRQDKTVGRGLHAYELQYDVWDDVYTIDHADSESHYFSFDAMANAVEHLRRIAIIPVEAIDPVTEYAVQFSVSVHPLRGSEQQIVGWVGENVGAQGSSHTQMLNVNDLIQSFFARDRDVSNRSDWFETEFFQPNRLPLSHEEDE